MNMCGIFALLNENNESFPSNVIINEFEKGKRRGPENSTLKTNYLQMILGFHRLAINGLNEASNQPLVFENIVLICNGEIYNYKNLYKQMNAKYITNSDCEVIIHLYIKYGIEQALIMLDGVYSFVLYDIAQNKIFVARDPIGVRPLYKVHNNNNNLYGFASELKCLEYFYNLNPVENCIEQFEPGTYSVFSYKNTNWEQILNKVYYIPTFSYIENRENRENKEKQMILTNISNYLNSAVVKRCNTTERSVACLLSGGLDSSLIAALVSNYFRENHSRQIETYSIGLKESEDIKYARIVADYIGSKHTEIIVTEREMFDAIPEVIKAIESYDTTTVRASIGNYLIGKYISANSDAKVIFNGDGADELFGGYLYMHKCLDDIDFDKETRRLIKDIHLFDVLRSDKSISSNGLEPRTPFLDKTFVNYVLSIPSHIRNHNNFGKPEKYLLRESFDEQQILLNEILWRKKEAFSDGVSSKGRSLFEILQEFIAEYYNDLHQIKEFSTIKDFSTIKEFSPSIELEKQYYKSIFDKEFPNCQHILPYFWMPKYTNATDPSARTLHFYNKPK
jgi:asparagine synthase (glutamine-hydrolysing)